MAEGGHRLVIVRAYELEDRAACIEAVRAHYAAHSREEVARASLSSAQAEASGSSHLEAGEGAAAAAPSATAAALSFSIQGSGDSGHVRSAKQPEASGSSSANEPSTS